MPEAVRGSARGGWRGRKKPSLSAEGAAACRLVPQSCPGWADFSRPYGACKEALRAHRRRCNNPRLSMMAVFGRAAGFSHRLPGILCLVCSDGRPLRLGGVTRAPRCASTCLVARGKSLVSGRCRVLCVSGGPARVGATSRWPTAQVAAAWCWCPLPVRACPHRKRAGVRAWACASFVDCPFTSDISTMAAELRAPVLTGLGRGVLRGVCWRQQRDIWAAAGRGRGARPAAVRPRMRLCCGTSCQRLQADCDHGL